MISYPLPHPPWCSNPCVDKTATAVVYTAISSRQSWIFLPSKDVTTTSSMCLPIREFAVVTSYGTFGSFKKTIEHAHKQYTVARLV